MILAHPLPLFARQGKGADVQIFTPKRRTARSSRRRSRPGPPGSSDLVTNLIDLSRLEAGAARPRPELWTGDDLVGRALETLGPAAERVEVRLPEEPVAAIVDGAQAERVLVNLLENAAKFSSTTDPIEVDVAATRRGDPRPRPAGRPRDRHLPRVAALDRCAGPRALGGRRRAGEGRSTRRGRRRLRDEAVRDGRAARALARSAASSDGRPLFP